MPANPGYGLHVEQLCYQRNGCSLFNSLSFTVAPGKLFQIIGNNGAGKTTLLRLLSGLLRPDNGEIFWQASAIYHNLPAYQQQLFYLDHAIAIKSQLTVAENIAYDHRLSRQAKKNSRAAMERLGLARFQQQLAGRLSRGQRQRIALTKLLLSEAALFILDEPFTALDDEVITLLHQIFAELLQQGRLLVVANHRIINSAHTDILYVG